MSYFQMWILPLRNELWFRIIHFFSSYVNIFLALFITVSQMTCNTQCCGFEFINGWRLIYSWPRLAGNWYLLSLSTQVMILNTRSHSGVPEKAYSFTTNDTLGFISGPNVFSKLASIHFHLSNHLSNMALKSVLCVCVIWMEENVSSGCENV